MSSAFSPENAPNGAGAPATDVLYLEAPATDTVLDSPARYATVKSDGTLSVITELGTTQTFPVVTGELLYFAFTEVLSATTADLLIYLK